MSFSPRQPGNHVRRFLLCALLPILCIGPLHAQIGNDNPTGTSGVFNGNVETAGSYDPYTTNVTGSVTDITVAGAVGAYPLAFTRTMNSRYTPGAGGSPFGPCGNWSHSYNWSIDPVVHTGTGTGSDGSNYLPTDYTVNYPDGRRISFRHSDFDTRFRGGPGVSDRFQQLTNFNGGWFIFCSPTAERSLLRRVWNGWK